MNINGIPVCLCGRVVTREGERCARCTTPALRVAENNPETIHHAILHDPIARAAYTIGKQEGRAAARREAAPRAMAGPGAEAPQCLTTDTAMRLVAEVTLHEPGSHALVTATTRNILEHAWRRLGDALHAAGATFSRRGDRVLVVRAGAAESTVQLINPSWCRALTGLRFSAWAENRWMDPRTGRSEAERIQSVREQVIESRLLPQASHWEFDR